MVSRGHFFFTVSDKICNVICSTENTSEGADGMVNKCTTPIIAYERKKSRSVPVSKDVFTRVTCQISTFSHA